MGLEEFMREALQSAARLHHQTVTYHGNGRITRQTVEGAPPDDIDLSTMTKEDEQEDPIFSAIVKHVTRQVKEQEG